jgi:hypothetical protein
VKQSHPKLALEFTDLLAERCCSNIKLYGSFAHAAQINDSQKIAQLS